jgi:LysM repeat protein
MYAAGYGIKPLRTPRRGGLLARAARMVAVLAVVALAGIALAVVAHGWSAPADSTVVVQPGDTLWSIATQRYPGDDVRARVVEIEQANGLRSPVIQAGETLHLPS